MKHLRLIALIGLIFGLVAYSYAQENGEAPKLTDEQKRFDLDGNGRLSPEEDGLMLESQF